MIIEKPKSIQHIHSETIPVKPNSNNLQINIKFFKERVESASLERHLRYTRLHKKIASLSIAKTAEEKLSLLKLNSEFELAFDTQY